MCKLEVALNILSWNRKYDMCKNNMSTLFRWKEYQENV